MGKVFTLMSMGSDGQASYTVCVCGSAAIVCGHTSVLEETWGLPANFGLLGVFVCTRRVVLHYIMIFACRQVMTKPFASVS